MTWFRIRLVSWLGQRLHPMLDLAAIRDAAEAVRNRHVDNSYDGCVACAPRETPDGDVFDAPWPCPDRLSADRVLELLTISRLADKKETADGS